MCRLKTIHLILFINAFSLRGVSVEVWLYSFSI